MVIKKSHLILWLITIVSYIGILALYSKLPQIVPTHWDINGEVNGTSDKKMMFLFGGLPILVNGLFYLLPFIDPKRKNYEPKTYNLMRWAIVLLCLALTWLSVATALKPDLNIKMILPAVIGVSFIVMGNYLPRIKNNFFVGIKNPWALSDDTIWRKTHKAGGYIFLAYGLFMLPMGLIQNNIYNNLVFGFLLFGVIAVNVYSYILFRKRNES